MGTKLGRAPSNEGELNKILQKLYSNVKENQKLNKANNFTGLLEIIESEANIVTTIHKIKSNKGSKTSGVDNKIIRDYLDKNYEDVIIEVQAKLHNYKPSDVKRVWIPKPGKTEKRPLGIPTIIDRIIQECVRNVIEPILEAQMFQHSYGFRPMRSADMAVSRIKYILFQTNCNWAVEGDIKGFFDNINHNVLIQSLWNRGIRDKRVLKIIKLMLKAGIMNETAMSELGTPQGGIISPLLANVYLDNFDRYMSREWENKKVRKKYSRDDGRISSMRLTTNLKQCYIIRYADDWVILTDSRENAEKLKYKAQKYLKNTLKLDLSLEKTLITNAKKKAIKFLGVEIKLLPHTGNIKWVNSVSPNKEKFKAKIKELSKEIRYLRKINTLDRERLVEGIERTNSKIRGILNYYRMCDKLSIECRKYAYTLKYTSYKAIKRHGGKWVRARDVQNLIGTHMSRNAHIPTIKYNGMNIGITSIEFAEWVNPVNKNQKETPYTDEGLELYWKRQKRKKPMDRLDEVNTSDHAMSLRMSKHKLYNFEYFMNRPYVYNRDRFKCKICGGLMLPHEVIIHHVNPKLDITLVNKVTNLITVHEYCHKLIHNDDDITTLSSKTQKSIKKYREKLEN